MWSQALSAGQISYIRSTDNGLTWGNIINLTETGHFGQYAHLIVNPNKIWISWMDNNLESIAIISSTNGDSWSAPIYKYTVDSQRWQSLGMTVNNDTIFIVYIATTRDSTGLKPFKALKSNDGGLTWSNLITFAHLQENVSISSQVLNYCCGNLIFALDPNIDSLGGGPHIVGYVSYDNGDHWSEPVLISPAQQAWALLPYPSCNQATTQLATGYMDYRYQVYAFYGDIFIRLLESDPQQLSYETQATNNHTAVSPSIYFYNTELGVVWADKRYSDLERDQLIFNRSTDAGISWSGETRLTETVNNSWDPNIYYNNRQILLTWREELSGTSHGRDLYFMKYTPDSSEILNTNNPKPSSFLLSAYPNPFNNTLSISINSENTGSIYISNILGRFINELKYPKGVSTIKWDATDKNGKALPSGAYFIKNKGGGYKDVLKVMYLK
jgi:hypothetical protein